MNYVFTPHLPFSSLSPVGEAIRGLNRYICLLWISGPAASPGLTVDVVVFSAWVDRAVRFLLI